MGLSSIQIHRDKTSADITGVIIRGCQSEYIFQVGLVKRCSSFDTGRPSGLRTAPYTIWPLYDPVTPHF